MNIYSKNANRTGKTLSILLLILFLGYYGSITFFTHVHIIDGVTIVHSHPYHSLNGNNQPINKHTNKELQVIQFLSDFFTTKAPVLFSALILRLLLYRILINATEGTYSGSSCFCTYSLRAPPLCNPAI